MRWIPDVIFDRLRETFRCPGVIGGRYALRGPLGEGGMGHVLLADDLELQRPVAVKVLKETIVDADAAERMLGEARIIARLEHPGIVPVHDVGRLPDGRIFYVMKLVRGVRLDARFSADAPLADRLRVFARICETVAFAHAHGVIHRDLKPQNIMVGEYGEVLVLDWGVAKVLSENAATTGTRRSVAPSSSPGDVTDSACVPAPEKGIAGGRNATAHGTILGTPSYMPPEQARGDVGGVDERSDVYALGAILYYLVTGRAPTGHRRDADSGATSAPSPSVRAVNRSAPKPVDSICAKAMSFRPADRYAGARALADDIVRVLNAERVSAHRESLLEKVARIGAANRTLIGLVFAYLTMRALLVLWGRG